MEHLKLEYIMWLFFSLNFFNITFQKLKNKQEIIRATMLSKKIIYKIYINPPLFSPLRTFKIISTMVASFVICDGDFV